MYLYEFITQIQSLSMIQLLEELKSEQTVYVDGRQILTMILKNKVNGDWINLAQLTVQW